jgi:hypothetical protein
MKIYIVPSSFFVPGNIMTPFNLQRDKDETDKRIATIKEQVKRLPGLQNKSNQLAAEIATFDRQYKR